MRDNERRGGGEEMSNQTRETRHREKHKCETPKKTCAKDCQTGVRDNQNRCVNTDRWGGEESTLRESVLELDERRCKWVKRESVGCLSINNQ